MFFDRTRCLWKAISVARKDIWIIISRACRVIFKCVLACANGKSLTPIKQLAFVWSNLTLILPPIKARRFFRQYKESLSAEGHTAGKVKMFCGRRFKSTINWTDLWFSSMLRTRNSQRSDPWAHCPFSPSMGVARCYTRSWESWRNHMSKLNPTPQSNPNPNHNRNSNNPNPNLTTTLIAVFI